MHTTNSCKHSANKLKQNVMNRCTVFDKLEDEYGIKPENLTEREKAIIDLCTNDFLENEEQALCLQSVINNATAQMIHYDLAIKANELMKQHDTMKVEDFRELPEVKRLWNAMDVIKEHYL